VRAEPIDALWQSAAPMLASGPPEPLAVPEGPQWSFEVKWDGVRALVRVGVDGAIGLRSRNGGDLSGRYPTVASAAVGAAVAPLAAEAVLDGECVALDAAGRPTLPGVLRGGRAVRLIVFDVLAWRGRDVRDEPLAARQDLLAGAGLDAATSGAWVVSERFDDGPALLAATREQGLEGVMAKRRDSRYACGVRSPAWVKLPHRTVTTVLVVGWVRAASGSHVSSLVVADASGVVLGTVGSGIGAALGRTLAAALAPVARDGPHPALARTAEVAAGLRRFGDRLTWVDPVLVADVRHLGRTDSGALRQPVLSRMRPDLGPDDLSGGYR
jgi:bifunctional non-homologous end joining protein LigD